MFAMTNDSINAAVQEIRVSDAVVVMGAGVSFAAGMPLAGQLTPLVWHTLDSSPKVLKLLCAELGSPVAPAKLVVGDDQTKVDRALKLIKIEETAQRTFKQSICDLDQSRTAIPSPAHIALARLIHGHKVTEVISFNWDTLLECAFRERFGFTINSQGPLLWKPHGDCEHPKQDWVLPHEDGVVPVALLERLSELARVRPRVLLIIGYSERDAEVVQQMIEPLAKRWRVFRVSPSATGEGAIRLPATKALELFADQLLPTPDVPGWAIVTFENQRGLEAAISGERLGPHDVEACPRLPHFSAAHKKLSILHTVEVAGDSGSGKSITVWQLAHELHRKGWLVLRLDPAQKLNAASTTDSLKSQGWKTVAVVDDSQVVSTELLNRLRDLASESLKIILGTTDSRGEQHEAIRAAGIVAVESLATYFRSKKASVLPIVQKFDSHIGDGFLDTRLEGRIDDAAKEKSPWQFAYVLNGGSRRVHSVLDSAHDFDEADILLVLIAARQLATLDAGTSLSDLIPVAQKVGKFQRWIQTALETLLRQKAILVSDTIRCIHLRSASAIIEVSLEMRNGQCYLDLVTLLQATLQDSSLPLQGISWLLQRFWQEHNRAVVTPSIKTQLISRCITAQTPLEIRDACFVMARLLGFHDESLLLQLLSNDELLRGWILAADVTNAYALGQVINNLHNDSSIRTAAFLEKIDPNICAEKIGSAVPTCGYVWGFFSSRLSVCGTKNWGAAVAAHLPREFIRHAVASVSADECEQVPAFIEGLAGFDFEFALQLFETASPALATAISRNSIRTFHTLYNSSHWLLGEGLFYDEKPKARQRAISKQIFRGVNPEEVVRGIVTCPYGEWEYYARFLGWVKRAHPVKHKAVVQAMNWSALDEVISDKLNTPGREFSLLMMSMILDYKSAEPVGAWLSKHAGKMSEIGARIAAISPDAACTILKGGGRVNLAHDHANWHLDTVAIARIAQSDVNAAKQVVESNIEHFAKAVAELSLPQGMPTLLRIVAEFPGLLERVLNSTDIDIASERWPRSLTDHRPDERLAARQVLKFITARNCAELGKLAGRLLREVRYSKRVKKGDNNYS